MKLDLYLNEKANVKAENKLLKFVVLVIGIVVVFNSFQIYKALNYQRTVLIPPGLNSKVDVYGDQISEEYVRTMVRYATQLAFTYSYTNARSQFDALLTMFDGDSVASAQATFYDLAATVEASHITSSFYLDKKILVDTTNKTIEVSGLNRKYKEALLVSEQLSTYILEYKVVDGKFLLTKITHKESVKVDKNAKNDKEKEKS